MFILSYTTLDDSEIASGAYYHLFKDFELVIYVYKIYGNLKYIELLDEKGTAYSSMDLTSTTGLTTWEDLLDWMIENNKNLTIGKNVSGTITYWGNNIMGDFYAEYNWAFYPTFSTVYIDNWGEDAYRGEPLYVDIQDLKDALIYEYEE